jgi:hypothetical protein
MRLFNYTAFLFYRYYSEGRWSNTSSAFFRTKCSLTLCAWFHIIQVSILLSKEEIIFQSRLTTIISLIPLFLLFSLLLKKNELEELREKYSYQWDKVFNSNVWLIAYIVISFALMVVLIIWNKE